MAHGLRFPVLVVVRPPLCPFDGVMAAKRRSNLSEAHPSRFY